MNETENIKDPALQRDDESEPSGKEMAKAMESTIDSLNRSLAKMEEILERLEAGDSDWNQSVRLLAEANEMAISSSRKLEEAVQDAAYGTLSEETAGDGGRDGA